VESDLLVQWEFPISQWYCQELGLGKFFWGMEKFTSESDSICVTCYRVFKSSFDLIFPSLSNEIVFMKCDSQIHSQRFVNLFLLIFLSINSRNA
jgi:hypothetical protein